MAKASNSAVLDNVQIRMYRGGTGDFFILLFKKGDTVSFKMMIDCGCISGSQEHFDTRLEDLRDLTGGQIDLLVVTHEHADHINGFEKAQELIKKKITFKKVWFSWTEDDEDSFANDLRKNYSELDTALKIASTKLLKLQDEDHFEKIYSGEEDNGLMIEGKKSFISGLSGLQQLNMDAMAATNGKPKPTMEKLLKGFGLLAPNTKVSFLEPGDLVTLPEAPGLRFFVLGPPKKRDYLNLVSSADGSYEKREKPSDKFNALTSALNFANGTASAATLAFESEYEADPLTTTSLMNNYQKELWRTVDSDWLLSAGSLALRYEASINNTSLALAIQFEKSEKVLLFPGDAELGSWLSWHDNLEWTVKVNGVPVTKDINYLLEHTVFYKAGHHLSQNGTAKAKGIDLMTSRDFTVMATLDFRRINTGWLNTMPNDLLCANLINKSKGKMFFAGERDKIMPNIKTDRVTVKKSHETTLNKLNKPFDDKIFIDCEIKG